MIQLWTSRRRVYWRCVYTWRSRCGRKLYWNWSWRWWWLRRRRRRQRNRVIISLPFGRLLIAQIHVNHGGWSTSASKQHDVGVLDDGLFALIGRGAPELNTTNCLPGYVSNTNVLEIRDKCFHAERSCVLICFAGEAKGRSVAATSVTCGYPEPQLTV